METNWLPRLSESAGPLYVRLADSIERDIESGALPAGAKLPPQRNLAFDVGVTLGTVTRAYALVRERGLVSGEVGRGTYVLDRQADFSKRAEVVEPAISVGGAKLENADGKLRCDVTAAPDIGQGDIIARLSAKIARERPGDVIGYTRHRPQRWLEAGSAWLARNGFAPPPEHIVPTLGAHAAVVATITAMTSPGDHIVFEHLTYAQIARTAGLLGRRVTMVESDEDGVRPDDLEQICAQRHPKMTFLIPSAQNPTCITMSEARRIAVAEIARKHNIWLIEDNIYGGLANNDLPLLAEIAPERTFLIDGLSKSVGAGIRGGWIACPPDYGHRVHVAHRMLTGGLPFLLAEMSAQLVLSGEAAEIRSRCTAENNARLAIVHEALEGYAYRSQANVPFVWLELPEPWLSGTFRNAASQEGVLVDEPEEFKAGRSDRAFHHVRIGISAPPERNGLARGMATIRRLMDEGGAGYDSVD